MDAQGPTASGLMVGEEPIAEDRQLGAHQGQPRSNRLLGTPLLVGQPHLSPLMVAEQGQVAGSGDVPLGELRRATHIQHRSLALQEGIDRQPRRHRAPPHGPCLT